MSYLKIGETLNEIAFKNVYNLLLRYVSAVFTEGTDRTKTVKVVRELLDEYLIGPKYSPIRDKLIAKYSQNHAFHWEELYLLLDCALDESSVKFSEYFSSHQAPPSHHAITLINTVVERCPLLQELSITIAHYRPILLLQHEILIANSFSRLENLTKLELNWNRQSSLPSSDYISFYSLIGKSCPKLAQLKLGQHFPFGNDQAVALVLGEKVHFLPELIKQQMRLPIPRIKIDDKYITPLCKSLQHLEAHFNHQSITSSDAICLLTFLLHHLPKLEILDVNSCMDYYEDFDHYLALAISILHKSDSALPPQTATVLLREGTLEWTVNASPPKSLNLRMLESSVRQYLDVCSFNQLNAVASLCPRLETVSFKDRYIERGDIELTPYQVGALFENQLQQVEEIFFSYVSSDYCRDILTTIGKQLIKIEFYHCEDMDLGCLLPCTNLEVLTIGKLCTVDASVSIQNRILLPKLKKLNIDHRLNGWSYLIPLGLV